MKLLLLEHRTEQKNKIQSMLEAQGHKLNVRIPSDLPEEGRSSAYDAVLLMLSPQPDFPFLLELCRQLRSLSCCAQSPILVLSDLPLSGSEIQFLLDAGIQDYLGPPFEADQLQQRFLIFERQTQELAKSHRRIRYLTHKQVRRQRTEKALRLSMEDALKKSWDYLEILNDSLEDVIITLTMPERVIEYVNRAVEKVLGYTLDECQGENFGIFFPDDRGERNFMLLVHEATKEQQSSLHTEYMLQRASGEQFTAEITTTFLYEQGKLTRTVSSIRDITERKEMEEALERERTLLALKVQERTGELQQANKELAQASQHKDRFLANMSHELRTPLNAILGYAKILQKGGGLTQLQQEGLHTIRKSGEHLLHLITDILDLSKIEAGRLELHVSEFYLPEFLSHIASMIRVRAEEKSIRFSYEHSSDLPQGIRADEKRLREILINLLDNAVKFTTRGSVVLRITIREKSKQQARLLFEVEDTGSGISPEHLNEVFQPFQQVGQQPYSTEGTGLGLTICQQLVRLMGGELELRSILDVGSTFSFELELDVLHTFSAQPQRRQTEVIGYDGPLRRIMLVDDNADNRAIFFNTLRPLGFELSEMESGMECLSKISDEPVDLLLLDLRMAGIDGFETARRLRMLPEGEDLKIVATSASVFEETRQKSLAAGCDDFLPKPTDDQELLNVLQKLLTLDWVCRSQPEEQEEASPAEISFPPLEAGEIEELRTFARYGNITRILYSLDQLEARGAKYQQLVDTLRSYSTSFQMKKILETIDSLETYDEAR